MTDATAKTLTVCNPGEGAQIGYYSIDLEKVLSGEASGGVLCIFRAEVESKDTPPLHIHHDDEEFWVVLEGRIRIWAGSHNLAECEVKDVVAGGFAFSTRGVPHSFATVTPTSKIITGLVPGNGEKYFDSVGQAPERQDDKHHSLHAKYGIEMVGPIPAVEVSE